MGGLRRSCWENRMDGMSPAPSSPTIQMSLNAIKGFCLFTRDLGPWWRMPWNGQKPGIWLEPILFMGKLNTKSLLWNHFPMRTLKKQRNVLHPALFWRTGGIMWFSSCVQMLYFRYIYICMHVFIHVDTCVEFLCTYVNLYIYIYTVYYFLQMHVYPYVYMYMYIYLYHTLRSSRLHGHSHWRMLKIFWLDLMQKLLAKQQWCFWTARSRWAVRNAEYLFT